MINQLEKIKCGYFECKKDNFRDIVAHAKDSHVDNPISLGRRKLDSVNQFKRTSDKSVVFFGYSGFLHQ
jgi:hypothetical protein